MTKKQQGQDRAVKFDGGKIRVDLVDPDFVEGVGKVLTFGAEKYSADNWMKGLSFRRVLGGMFRHLLAIMRQEDTDPETGLLHAHHLACGCMFIAYMWQRPAVYAVNDDRQFNTIITGE